MQERLRAGASQEYIESQPKGNAENPEKSMPTHQQPRSRDGNAPHHEASGPASRRSRTLLLLAACFMLAGVRSFDGQKPPDAPPMRPVLPSEAPRRPDANEQARMREEQVNDKTQQYAAANIERKKQIADDSAKILKLATELKSEVDNTSKDTLSLSVIRKADEIEKLAHGVKVKMKLSEGAN